MTKIFATGVTGYIGGDALYEITQAHPDYEITALVRNSDKGAKVAKVYPKIRLVYGDLDSSDLITAEAQKADIVLSEYPLEMTARLKDHF
jgi:N-acetyl-gamma-glutamylphosphate reductase